MKNNTNILLGLMIGLLAISCGETSKKADAVINEIETVVKKAPAYDAQSPESILANVAFAQGGWDDLYSKKDVQYTYDYRYPDGKADVSQERYMFSNEASYAVYSQNDINAMPGMEGKIEQYFDGEKAHVMVDGKELDDPAAIGGTDFLRRANYFWFVMSYKLSDKGTVLKAMGQEEYNGISYDKVAVSYDPAITGKEQNDSYILYVNPDTKMIDRFLFSLPAMGVNVPAIVGNYEYEDIEGQKIATKRTYFMPNEKGEYGETPSIVQTLTNVKFNNGFTKETIMK